MTSRTDSGIVFHLFSRVFVAIAAIAVFVPMAYVPAYKERVTSIIASQGQSFASTFIAENSEALYTQDYALVIDHAQSVLRNDPGVLSISVQPIDGTAVVIRAESWSLEPDLSLEKLDENEHQIRLFDGDVAYFEFDSPIVISNLEWGSLKLNLTARKYEALMREYYLNYLVLAICIILGVLALMYYSSRPIVKQLEQLRSSTDQLAEGDLNARVSPGGVGELAPLSEAFNSMAEALQHETQRTSQLAGIVQEASQGIALFDNEGKLVFANQALNNLLNVTEELPLVRLGQYIGKLSFPGGGDPRDALLDRLEVQLDAVVAGTSPELHVDMRLRNMRHESIQLEGYVLSVEDISARKTMEQRLHELAHYDSLTNLANRHLFQLSLEKLLSYQSKQFVVLFMDLDDFKGINDIHGHEAGDYVLRQASQRLQACVRDDDLLARLGGDEFTAIINHKFSHNDIAELCTRIVRSLSQPINYQGVNLLIGVSVGAVRVPQDANTRAQVMRSADLAMYDAKNKGKSRYTIFNRDLAGGS